MLIKSADDKSKRLKLLEDLQDSNVLDRVQREWLSKQLWNQRIGIAGERDSAHYIDNHYRDRDTHAVIHDLRIKVDDEVAQIDHLVISRGMHFYLLETKSFNGSLFINEHGEFSVKYGSDAVYGIPSPLEQSQRQANVLSKLLQRLDIGSRIRSTPHFHHIVLVHPKAQITRPEKFDTSHVIKADSFATWHAKFQDKLSVGDAISAIFDMRRVATLKELAQKIARQHKPIDLLELPDFMAPKKLIVLQPLPIKAQQPPSPSTINVFQPAESKKRLICKSCSAKITIQEGRFCWNNERRFGGGQYCREHQREFI